MRNNLNDYIATMKFKYIQLNTPICVKWNSPGKDNSSDLGVMRFTCNTSCRDMQSYEDSISY